jgi:hypothetical protein
VIIVDDQVSNVIYIHHPLQTDMPNSEEYVKLGESTPITTTGRVFSLHHSATISYHFYKILILNALEMTLLSNDVHLHANDWTFFFFFFFQFRNRIHA